MLARRSQLRLPDGSPCDLPLLVPSFSSKGFGFGMRKLQGREHLISNVALDMHEFAQTACHSVLVSAYDLHFRHFNGIPKLRGGPLDWLEKARVIFLDSGGYELASDFDSSEPKSPTYEPREGYGLKEYRAVLEGIREDPQHRSFVVTNFDWDTARKPLSKQVEAARRIFQLAPDQLHSFIIKPPVKGQTDLDPQSLSRNDLKSMAGFHLVGVTEKELGLNHLDRLRRIARLRRALDEAEISAPIHVWGGLDPVMTPLYFFAGAQVFDGVSWLRYAYCNGVAINREAFPVLSGEYNIGTNREVCRQVISLKNRTFLETLAGELRKWVDGGGRDFSMFDESVREHLRSAYQTMITEIPELKEVAHGR